MINFSHVTFSYNAKKSVLEDMTFQVSQGQTVGLLGHNGAGKTTTFRLILGLLKPQNGLIEVDGFGPAGKNRPRSLIACMPESIGIYEKLTGYQNLEFRARAAGVGARQVRSRSEDLLERLGLANRAKERAGFWSKGLRQRLSLACALICQPKLLLLDEPTNGLDPESLSVVIRILKEVQAQGTTMVVSSHDLNSVHDVCSQIVILQNGQVIHAGELDSTPEALRDTYLKLTAEKG